MVSLGLLLSVVVAPPAQAATSPLSWTDKTAMPSPRARVGAAVGDDGAIYVFGGSSASSGTLATVERYDPTSGTWSSRAPMLSPRGSPRAVTAANGKIYAVGGFTSDAIDTVEEYDPVADRWTAKRPYPRTAAGVGAVAAPDGLIYYFGGYPGCCFTYLTDVYAYDPATDTYTSRAPMPVPREGAAAAWGPEGKIYVVGGNGPNRPGLSQTVEVYDPTTNTWTEKQPMPAPGATYMALVPMANGKLYAISDFDNQILEYDPQQDSWTPAGSLPTQRIAPGIAVTRDGRIYVIGGIAVPATQPYTFLATNEEGRLTAPRASHLDLVSSTVPLDSGSCSDVLFVGVSGSGEQHRIGPEMEIVRSAVDQALPQDVTLRQIYIDYAAAPVDLQLLTSPGQNAYWSSITEGDQLLSDALVASMTTCGGTERWIVAGYSQGALVVNNTIRGFSGTRWPTSSVVLLADPARVPNQVGTAKGTAVLPGYGVYHLVNPNVGPLPAGLGSKVTSICNLFDIVCDTDHVPPRVAGTVLGLAVHLAYRFLSVSLLRATGAAAAAAALPTGS